jgi:hypothetical protein
VTSAGRAARSLQATARRIDFVLDGPGSLGGIRPFLKNTTRHEGVSASRRPGLMVGPGLGRNPTRRLDIGTTRKMTWPYAARQT